MEQINLYKYIKNGLFLKNLGDNNPYDLIIFENEINTDNINNCEIKSFSQLDYDFSINGKLLNYSKKFTNILIIIDQLNMLYITPMISKFENISIINLGTGISGLNNKNNIEENDIGLSSLHNLEIYEPYDLNNLIEILLIKNNKYVRISNKELSSNIFQNENIEKGNIINLTNYGFVGEEGTILTGGYLLPETINALLKLQEKGSYYDLFIINNYNFDINNELNDSIQKTEKIICIIDQIGLGIEEKIKSKLWDKGLFDTEIYFIKPETNNIISKIPEYIFNESRMDSDNILSRLENIN